MDGREDWLWRLAPVEADIVEGSKAQKEPFAYPSRKSHRDV